MALIGGETAEMPGLYQPKDFDCAGFAVGAVDKPKILGAHKVQKGMQVVGVSSSGFHSNGFSLLRKLYTEKEDLKIWGEKLLTPTALYVNLAMDVLRQMDVAALAHITGGGIHNVGRVLPEGTGLFLKDWNWPELFTETMNRAQISKKEMLKTFNCGVGLTFIVSQDKVADLKVKIEEFGFNSFDLGEIKESQEKIVFPEGMNG